MDRLRFILATVCMLLLSKQAFSGDLNISLTDQVNHLSVKKLNGKGQVVSIDKYVASRKIEELRILAQPGNSKFQYAVIQVNGYLYGEARGHGFCGAGEEENTLWLKFDEKLNIVDVQSYLTTSCRESIGSTTLLRHDADLLEIELEYSKAGEDNKNRLRYSSYEPDKGFQKLSRPPK